MPESCVELIHKALEPTLLQVLSTISSLGLFLVALAGVIIAWRIPQRISKNELEVRENQLSVTRNAVKVVLIEELELVKSQLGSINPTIQEALKISDGLDDDETITNPFTKYQHVEFPEPSLLFSPSDWLNYLDAPEARSLVRVQSQFAMWQTLFVVSSEGDELYADGAKTLAKFFLDALGAIDEALSVLDNVDRGQSPDTDDLSG